MSLDWTPGSNRKWSAVSHFQSARIIDDSSRSRHVFHYSFTKSFTSTHCGFDGDLDELKSLNVDTHQAMQLISYDIVGGASATQRRRISELSTH